MITEPLPTSEQTFERLVQHARKKSTKFSHLGDVNYPHMVGYYEALLRRLMELPDVAELVNTYIP